MNTGNLIGGSSFTARDPNPAWLKNREETYAAISARRKEELERKIPVAIKVTMPDGNVLEKMKDGEEFMV